MAVNGNDALREVGWRMIGSRMEQARKLPMIEPAMRNELGRIAQAVIQAIDDDEGSMPREVRVYYQARRGDKTAIELFSEALPAGIPTLRR
jgi:hypothetical protein